MPHSEKDDRPIKGILKMPLAPNKPLEHRIVDHKLILLLKDIKDNPALYPKEKT